MREITEQEAGESHPSQGPGSRLRQHRAPTAIDWEQVRPLVQDLYGTDTIRSDASKIASILQALAERNFHTSESSLRRRLKKWGGPGRYTNASQMALVIRKAHEAGTQDVFKPWYFGDKIVTLDDAYRYFERKGIKRDTWNSQEPPRADTPPGFRSRAPSQEPSPRNRADSDSSNSSEVVDPHLAEILDRQVMENAVQLQSFHFSELPPLPTRLPLEKTTDNLSKSVYEFFSYNIASGRWVLGTVEENVDDACPSKEFGSLFLQYHNNRDMRQYKAATSTLKSICSMTKSLVHIEDPRLLIYILEALAFCRANGYSELANQVLLLFWSYSKELHGLQHHMTVFCAALLNHDPKAQDILVESILVHMQGLYRHYLMPPYTFEMTKLLLTGAMVLKHLRIHDSACEFLNWLLPMYQAFFGIQSWQTVQCIVDKAHILLAAGELAEAEKHIIDATRCCEGISDIKDLAESRIRCLVCLATLRELQGDLSQKQIQLQLAFDAGQQAGLADDHWAMRDTRSRLVKMQQEMVDAGQG